MSDWVMGQYAAMTQLWGTPSFIALGEGVISGTLDKLMGLSFVI